MRTHRLILASASAARARLLASAGIEFDCDAADLDETAIKNRMAGQKADVTDLASVLSKAKATVVSERHGGAYVIGADQVLDLEGQWFDKPANVEAARRQLEALRGRTHRLVSGVCVVRDGTLIWEKVETARLKMRGFSDEFLDEYLDRAGDACCQSVGAYHLEGLGAQLFERIDGDHFMIQGLPMLSLLGFLRRERLLMN
ncbi:MAG: Maf family protein [Rhodospirillales bacterium]|nr:Maf family protein [Rhodospirillales bacterium]